MARKAPPRRSKAAGAGVPVLQQSPAPPALRPKIAMAEDETPLPTPSVPAPAPGPEPITVVERQVEETKEKTAAANRGPTKCLTVLP